MRLRKSAGPRTEYQASCAALLPYSAACAVSPSFTPRTAYSAATLIASTMLTALAFPVPAISNAVP